MDHTCDYNQMINIIPDPAFIVQNGSVVCCNQAAAQLLLEPGTAVAPMLKTGAEEYAQFSYGQLYLDLTIQGVTWGASITKLSEGDLFCLEQVGVTPELKAMSLLCSQLRIPLSDLTITATKSAANPSGELLQGLDRINCILCNVSNAHRFELDDGSHRQARNICSVLNELLQECRDLLAQANINLVYELPSNDIFTEIDMQMLQQAMYNLLSNAAKHTKPGGTINVTLIRQEKQLLLTVRDFGSGINPETSNLFSRYKRQPCIESSLNGVGLGMTIIRRAASTHGGAVLIDTPADGGTRVSMTLQIRTGRTMLHTPISTIIRSKDDGKVMLSGVLPPSVYEQD